MILSVHKNSTPTEIKGATTRTSDGRSLRLWNSAFDVASLDASFSYLPPFKNAELILESYQPEMVVEISFKALLTCRRILISGKPSL